MKFKYVTHKSKCQSSDLHSFIGFTSYFFNVVNREPFFKYILLIQKIKFLQSSTLLNFGYTSNFRKIFLQSVEFPIL